jgi:hypothetical protein
MYIIEIWQKFTIVPSKLRNDRFLGGLSVTVLSITKDIFVYLVDHNSLQAACEKLQVSTNCDHQVHKYVLRKNGRFAVYWEQ